MNKEWAVTKTTKLNAPVARVWEALTNPEMTKQYFFNCEAISDWNPGSPISFKFESEGKEIVAVKGVITAIEPKKLLQYTCFSPEFEDDPSKHTTVTFKLSSENDMTELTVTQGNFGDEKTYNHTDTSWDTVLTGLKTLLENPK